MANLANGTTWLENTPVVTDLRSAGHQEILGLRIGVKFRMNKEHNNLNTLYTIGDSSTGGGEHVRGSAVAFFEDTEHDLNRVDADTTTFTDDDSGRLWVDTTGSSYVMKVYDHDDTSFHNTSGTQKTTGSFTTTDLTSVPQTADCLFVPDLFTLNWFGFSYTFLPALQTPQLVTESTGVTTFSITFSIAANTVTMTRAAFGQTPAATPALAYWQALKF